MPLVKRKQRIQDAVTNVAALRALPQEDWLGTIDTLGHTTAGDGGGATWFWDATSTATDNTGTVLNPTANAGAGRFLNKQWLDTREINVRCFGAVCDGVADDGAAVQSALTFVSDNAGTLTGSGRCLIVSRNLFMWAKGSVSAPRLTLVWSGAIPTNASSGPEYGFLFGIKAKGSAPAGGTFTWSGTYTLHHEVLASSNVQRLHNYILADGWHIKDCWIDATANDNVGPFAGLNNGLWWTGAVIRSRGKVTGCVLIANQVDASTAGEGISVGDGAADIEISGNYIYGFGDDPLAAHASNRVQFLNNHVWAAGGRCAAFSSNEVVFRGNYLHRITQPDGTWLSSSWFIHVDYEPGYSDIGGSDITIDNNSIYHGLSTSSQGCIQIWGGRGFSVTNNKIYTRRDTQNGIMLLSTSIPAGHDVPAWEATTLVRNQQYAIASGQLYRATVKGTTSAAAPSHTTGTAVDGTVTWQWISAASTTGKVMGVGGVKGLDAGTTMRLFDGVVSGNIAHGPGKVIISQSGPATSVGSTIMVSNNIVDQYVSTSSLCVVDSSNKARDTADAPFESCLAHGEIVATASAVLTTDSVATVFNFEDGPRWYTRRRIAITGIRVRHNPITAGYFLGDVLKNGVTSFSAAGLNWDGDTTNPRGRYVSTSGVVGTTLAAGDYLTVQATKDPSLTPTALAVTLDIYGIEF